MVMGHQVPGQWVLGMGRIGEVFCSQKHTETDVSSPPPAPTTEAPGPILNLKQTSPNETTEPTKHIIKRKK